MTADTRICAGCKEATPIGALLEVVDTRTGAAFWVHRPATQRPCFNWRVMGASVHRIVPRKPEAEA